VGVKPIRACCGVRGLLCCGAPPQGLCKAPHGPGTCSKQIMMCLEATWFVAAFHSTPMHDPGPEEFQRPVRVCVCKGASVLPCLLSCCCWHRRSPAVQRSRLRAAPPPGACPPESPRAPWLPHEGGIQMAKGGGGRGRGPELVAAAIEPARPAGLLLKCFSEEFGRGGGKSRGTRVIGIVDL
jgi:hypothetical protein